LSDEKNLKSGPRCQEGRAEEIVAMIWPSFRKKGAQFNRPSRSSESRSCGIEGSR